MAEASEPVTCPICEGDGVRLDYRTPCMARLSPAVEARQPPARCCCFCLRGVVEDEDPASRRCPFCREAFS